MEYNTIFGTIPLISFIADVIIILAVPVGIFGLILKLKDWFRDRKHGSQEHHKDYND